VTEKYQKEVFQEKMRAYLDVLRRELDEIEAYIDRDNPNVEIDNPETVVDRAEKIDDRASGLQHAVEDTDRSQWDSIRKTLQKAFDDLLQVISFLEHRIEGMEARQAPENIYD